MIARANSLSATDSVRLSYKFQRLREQLRQSIVSGQFSGRLPGERELGKRFAANAKTVNKALCDLAAEGLVVRHIGKGTYVALPATGEDPGRRQRVVHWVFRPNDVAGVENVLPRLIEEQLMRSGHQLIRRPVDAPDGESLNPNGHFFRGDGVYDAVLLFLPKPLAEPAQGQAADPFLFSLARRQIPTIYIGATCDGMKRHALAPDYNEAGFATTETLIAQDCKRIMRVVSTTEGSAVRAALGGSQAAAARRGIDVDTIVLTADRQTSLPPLPDGCGLLTVGAVALSTAVDQLAAQKKMPPIAAVLEPGSDAGRQLKITAYEFEPQRLAEWAVKLILDVRAGSPPIHVLVPGSIKLRTMATPLTAISRPAGRPAPGVAIIQ